MVGRVFKSIEPVEFAAVISGDVRRNAISHGNGNVMGRMKILWEEGNSVVSCGNANGRGNNIAPISVGINFHGQL